MGDRRMTEIKTEGGSIFLYSHWGGYAMAGNAINAIKAAESRWGDHSYAMRIIVDQMTKQGRDQETGYGLMLGPDAEDSYYTETGDIGQAGDRASIVINLLEQTLTADGSTRAFRDL